MDSGDIKTACEKFEESQRLEPAPGTLLNLADCEERSGKFVHASEHFRLAASGFGRTDPRRAFALDKASSTAARIAKVVFKVDASFPEGAQVRAGDVVVRKFDDEIMFDPGPLTITVDAKGRETKTMRIELEAGKKVDVTLETGGPATTTSEPGKVIFVQQPGGPKEPPPGTHPLRTVGLVSMIAGGVVLAAGAGLGVYALDRGGVYGNHCNRKTNFCDSEGVDAASAVSWLAPVSTIAVIAGAAIAGTGVVLFVTAPKTKSTTTSVYVQPTLGGALLGGAF